MLEATNCVTHYPGNAFLENPQRGKYSLTGEESPDRTRYGSSPLLFTPLNIPFFVADQPQPTLQSYLPREAASAPIQARGNRCHENINLDQEAISDHNLSGTVYHKHADIGPELGTANLLQPQ